MATQTQAAPNEWFISYSSADRDAVVEIENFLSARGVDTFFDCKSLTPGLPWFDELEAALLKARGALVILGPSGLGSIQKRELQLALVRQARTEVNGQPFRVIPVLLPSYDSRNLPGFAALNTWVEISNPKQPLEILNALERGLSDGEQTEVKVPRLCPYRGLNSFREEDASLYFGRAQESQRLFELVRNHRFTAVVGPSGTGKSSLAQAGLLPLLRVEHPPQPTWDAIVFSPGKNPFYGIASSLSRLWLGGNASVASIVEESERVERQLVSRQSSLSNYIQETLRHLQQADRLLLVVDQFEELFTQVTDEKVRRAFIDSILSCVNDAACSAVITLRADYYGRAIELSSELSAALEASQLNAGPIGRSECRDIIIGPAERTGISFEDGLVDRILDDVEKQPGSLPLLEFTLTELWQRLVDRKFHSARFIHDDYEKVGKLSGAITTRAEAVLLSLTDRQRQAAPSVLTRLVRVASANEEGASSRQTVRAGELGSDGKAILEAFAQSRLVVFDSDESRNATVEVAHEALIRNWSTLQDWINADIQFLLWRQSLATYISEWERVKKDPSGLLTGALLTDGRQWYRSHGSFLSGSERRYLEASIKHDSGSKVKRYLLAAGIFILLLGIGGYVGYQYWFTSTDVYQIQQVLAHAPVSESAYSGRSSYDPYIEAPQDWIKALVDSGRISRAETDQKLIFESCAKTTLLTEKRAAEANVDKGEISGNVQGLILGFPNQPENIVCASGLSLTADEKQAALNKARNLPELPLNQGFLSSINLTAAEYLLQNGDPKGAHEQAILALGSLASIPPDKRYGPLNQFLEGDLVGLLSESERSKLRQTANGANSYYLGSLEFEFEIAKLKANGDLPEKFFESHRPNYSYADEYRLGKAAGEALVTIARRGETDVSVASALALAGFMKDQRFDRAYVYALTVLANELARTGHTSQALKLADSAWSVGNQIPNDDDRSRILSKIARIYARCGRLKTAREVSDRCSKSLDRLYAYAAIVANGPK
jgi:KaiC/GvpD/RAD55 family RecA-like ATPase